MKERREKTRNDYEQESTVSGIVGGLICIVFGMFLLLMKSFVLGVVFVAAGVFLLFFKSLEKQKAEALKDENSRESIAYRQGLEKKISRAAQKAHSHKNLKTELIGREVRTSAVIFAVSLIFLLIMMTGNGEIEEYLWIIVFLAIVAICSFIYMIYAFMGKSYKKALAEFENAGGNRADADSEFAEGALFKTEGNSVCIGRNYIFCLNGRKMDVIAANDVVWMFANLKLQYNYYNGIYTGKTKLYHINFCTSDGRIIRCGCSEEGGILIIDEVHHNDARVIAGWSEELWNLYSQSPADFLDRLAGIPLPSPYETAGKE